MRLGISVGVANGKASTGPIGAISRLEYTAVSAAVNLASRLCAEAADGEILIAAETRSMVGSMVPGMVTTTARAVRLKGYPQALQAYSIADA